MGICASCQAKLDGPEPTTLWCAFNEVHPLELQAQVPGAGIMIEDRLMADARSGGPSTTPVPGLKTVAFHSALLDRLTHHVHILEMNGESYRLKRSRENAAAQAPENPEDA